MAAPYDGYLFEQPAEKVLSASESEDEVGSGEESGSQNPAVPSASVESDAAQQSVGQPVPSALPGAVQTAPDAPSGEDTVTDISAWREYVKASEKLVPVDKLCWDLNASEGQIRKIDKLKVTRYVRSLINHGVPQHYVDTFLKETTGIFVRAYARTNFHIHFLFHRWKIYGAWGTTYICSAVAYEEHAGEEEAGGASVPELCARGDPVFPHAEGSGTTCSWLSPEYSG